MTKSEIITEVAEKIGKFSNRDIEIIVDMIFGSMIDSLSRGDKIEIRGFGSFKVKERMSRKGRNPKTGSAIDIPSKKVPFFKAGKELKERVDN